GPADGADVPAARGAGPFGAARAVDVTRTGDVTGTAGSGDSAAAGVARRGATGSCRGAGPPTDGEEGSGRRGCVGPASIPRPASGCRTGDGAAVNDGFCHVGSRPPNPASATLRVPPSVARWIRGRPDHAATAAGPDPAPGVGADAAGVVPSSATEPLPSW